MSSSNERSPDQASAGSRVDTSGAEAWRRFTDALAASGDAVFAREAIGRDAGQQAEMAESLAYALVAGLLGFTNLDRDRPEFLPLLNSGMRRYAANADTIYRHALISGQGQYRITGRRKNAELVVFQIVEGDNGFGDIAVTEQLIVPKLEAGQEDAMEIIVSAERPEGYSGLWMKLDPTVPEQFIAARFVAKDWATELDPQIAIEPLHCSIRKLRDHPTSLFDRLELAARYVQGVTEELMGIMRTQLATSEVPNQLFEVTHLLPTIAGQAYTHGVIETAPDEAWIAEIDLPEAVAYWSVQLLDYAYSTLDFPFRQCAINSDFGTIDSDGRLRIVVCDQDPGVANWLDKNGYGKVQMRCRWLGSSHPAIRTRVVPLKELHAHLPADTVTVSVKDREAFLRKRSIGAQMRSRW